MFYTWKQILLLPWVQFLVLSEFFFYLQCWAAELSSHPSFTNISSVFFSFCFVFLTKTNKKQNLALWSKWVYQSFNKRFDNKTLTGNPCFFVILSFSFFFSVFLFLFFLWDLPRIWVPWRKMFITFQNL